jgi:2-hydroxy-3-oxopropionate reductase
MSARPAFGASTAIGFVGLGVMGTGMAANLLKKGHRVQVFARRADAAQPLLAAGATPAPTLAALGAACELVFLCVSDDAAVEAVLFGPDSLRAGMRPGSVVVDTSTIASTSARAFATRLAELGVGYLDAPVSGGQQGATDGTLGCMVGGEAATVEACRPVMQAFCKTITHVGPVGAGQTVKSCNQVAVSAAMLGVADAIALAVKQGVDPAVMRDVILGGTGRSVPMERMAPRVIAGDFKPGFRARLMRKDLRIALASAQDAGVELSAAPAVLDVLEALCDGGREDWDWCAIALEIQRRSGIAIPDNPAA